MVYGLGYGGSFTLVQARAAQLYGRADGFALLQSGLAVAQYVGSFLGVLLTAQLREATSSFVAPFAIFPALGALVTAHCWRVYGEHGAGLAGGTSLPYTRTA